MRGVGCVPGLTELPGPTGAGGTPLRPAPGRGLRTEPVAAGAGAVPRVESRLCGRRVLPEPGPLEGERARASPASPAPLGPPHAHCSSTGEPEGLPQRVRVPGAECSRLAALPRGLRGKGALLSPRAPTHARPFPHSWHCWRTSWRLSCLPGPGSCLDASPFPPGSQWPSWVKGWTECGPTTSPLLAVGAPSRPPRQQARPLPLGLSPPDHLGGIKTRDSVQFTSLELLGGGSLEVRCGRRGSRLVAGSPRSLKLGWGAGGTPPCRGHLHPQASAASGFLVCTCQGLG